MIQVESLTKYYGSYIGVEGVSVHEFQYPRPAA